MGRSFWVEVLVGFLKSALGPGLVVRSGWRVGDWPELGVAGTWWEVKRMFAATIGPSGCVFNVCFLEVMASETLRK